jgi:Tfp pilus assembly protein FimT
VNSKPIRRTPTISGQAGFTVFEIGIVLVIVSILSGLAVKPLTAWIQRINAQKAADGLKHYILAAKSRAVSNANRHCGVVFKLHPTGADDTVLAFFDKVPINNVYDKGTDSVYSRPYIIKKSEQITSTIPSPYPSVIVFRGDGSANASANIVLTLKNIKATVDVLASTGRVKVVMK